MPGAKFHKVGLSGHDGFSSLGGGRNLPVPRWGKVGDTPKTRWGRPLAKDREINWSELWGPV